MLVGHGWQKNDACALKIQPVHVKMAAISGTLGIAVLFSAAAFRRGTEAGRDRDRDPIRVRKGVRSKVGVRARPRCAHFMRKAKRMTSKLLTALAAGALALLVSRLPDPVALPLIVAIAVAAIWSSLRFALPHADRASLGKTGRKLRLIS